VLHLDELNIKQVVYSAVRSKGESLYNTTELSHVKLHIHNILSIHDLLLFRLKVRKIYKDLYTSIDISNAGIIHAHTLYSDGAVALKVKERFGIPFVVSVRQTAFNAFGKYRPDLKWRRDKILTEAKKVVFLSPAYKEKIFLSIDNRIRELINNKIAIIPNGVDSYFLNTKQVEKKRKSTLQLLFVGRFLKLKNIPTLIRAVEKLQEKIKVTLTLVGKGEEENRIGRMIGSNPNINYVGFIKDKEKLTNIYQSHDIFIMVSEPETFGLVYIEALSQGLPIIHTKGEGIDGYFENKNISETVGNPNDIEEIVRKIELLADRLDNKLIEKCKEVAQQFDWSLIADQYKTLYNVATTQEPN